MDSETKQETSPNHPNQTIHTAMNDSNKKQPGSGGGSINDRIKRDEWSEGAVSSLLEAYETKWVHRNRTKLKGQDWEEVAKLVSSRGNSTKSHKTQTQCKNKIESMKKRYRSESAVAESSSWPLFSRLDHLLRVSGTPLHAPLLPQPQLFNSTVMMHGSSLLVSSQPLPPPEQPPSPLTTPLLASPVNIGVAAENSNGSNGADRTAKDTKSYNHKSDKKALETDSSTPALCSDKEKTKSENLIRKTQRKKKRRREEWNIGDSVRWLAEVVLRTEQARLDAMRDLERMRAESEAKRGEMELKCTEIIANTHLEIAKIFAANAKGVESSFKIGRSG